MRRLLATLALLVACATPVAATPALVEVSAITSGSGATCVINLTVAAGNNVVGDGGATRQRRDEHLDRGRRRERLLHAHRRRQPAQRPRHRLVPLLQLGRGGAHHHDDAQHQQRELGLPRRRNISTAGGTTLADDVGYVRDTTVAGTAHTGGTGLGITTATEVIVISGGVNSIGSTWGNTTEGAGFTLLAENNTFQFFDNQISAGGLTG